MSRSSFEDGIWETDTRKRVLVFGGKRMGSRLLVDSKIFHEKMDTILFFLNDPILVTNGETDWNYSHGCKVGVGLLTEVYATKKMLRLEIHRPDFTKFKGDKAKRVRDKQMVKAADFGIAFIVGEDADTLAMIKRMKDKGKPVRIIRYLLNKKGKK